MMTKTKKGYVSSMTKERSYGKTIKVMAQTGTRISIERDRGRKAKLPGKRISRTGKIYFETRKNRSDKGLSNL